MAQVATSKMKFSRFSISKGLVMVLVSTALLYLLSAIFAPSSVTAGPQLGMLPFAAVLAVVGLGQMLVIQQAGIDLSVPGAVSLAIVIVSHQPNGDDGKLMGAVLTAYLFAIGAGLLNGVLVGRLGLSPIIATLGTNALLYGAVLGISGGIPRTTTRLLASITGGTSFGVPNSIWIMLAIFALVATLLRKTVAGRRYESIGASAPAAAVVGLRVKTHKVSAYLWASMLYTTAGIMLAGITNQPTAFQGDSYLLPSVAVVVLGGTSLLGGRGLPAATVVAAIFLTQLDQFVLALGVPYAVRTLAQAAALGIGVAIYTINWRPVRDRVQELLNANRVSDKNSRAAGGN